VKYGGTLFARRWYPKSIGPDFVDNYFHIDESTVTTKSSSLGSNTSQKDGMVAQKFWQQQREQRAIQTAHNTLLSSSQLQNIFNESMSLENSSTVVLSMLCSENVEAQHMAVRMIMMATNDRWRCGWWLKDVIPHLSRRVQSSNHRQATGTD